MKKFFYVVISILLVITVVLLKTSHLVNNGNTVSKLKSSSIQTKQIQNIEEIKQDVNVGKQYEAVLTVTKFNIDNKTQTKFSVISDGSLSMDAVIFKEVEITDFIKVNSKYKITGTLNIYKSKYELIINKIEDFLSSNS